MPTQRTIGRLWRDAVAARHATPAYLYRVGTDWHPLSWREAEERVTAYANGLLARGISKGDCVGLLARTTVEWSLFDFALARIGGVTAPIYATSSAKEVEYFLDHSQAVGILVEDGDQQAKVESSRQRLPNLREVWTMADLDELADAGRAYGREHPGALADAEAAVTEDDLFTFIYTSGTTGPPKACMLRHRNYYEMADIVRETAIIAPGSRLLLYLPLAHNFGRLTSLVGPMLGGTVAFEPNPYAVADALIAVKPDVFPSVPRIYEKIHTAVVTAFDEATGAKRHLINWALGVGRRASAARAGGRPLPPGLAFQHRLADKLVYSKVKERLGGRLQTPISGGAPLAKEVATFFDALDICILEAYGLSECTSGATANTPGAYRFGTVGKALPRTEIRFADDGELFLRGPTIFAGYYRDQEATDAVLDKDGWLATGDVASIDADGFITITDRKKDLIVTAGGKNIAPQNLENDLKTSRWVSQALVVGDRRPYVVALVTLDEAEVGAWLASTGNDGAPSAGAELARSPKVHELIQAAVDTVNRDRTRVEQIKRFAILDRDFTIDAGELTPTLKLRRRICEQHFADEIERLYADDFKPFEAAGAP